MKHSFFLSSAILLCLSYLCSEASAQLATITFCQNEWTLEVIPKKCSCAQGCSKCQLSQPNICLTCNEGFYLKDTTCKPILSCPSGTYFNQLTESCSACDTTCATCTDGLPTSCTSCASGAPIAGVCTCTNCIICSLGFYVLNGVCVPIPTQQCLIGTYYDQDTTSCANCDPSCLSCNGPSATNCTACVAGVPDSSGKCGCIPGTCTSCPSDQYLKSGICTIIPICGVGKYFDQATESCKDCDSSCLTCNGPTTNNCTSCLSGLPNSLGECGCIPGTCTSCPNGQYPLNGVCTVIPICGVGKYFDQAAASCKDCDSSCLTCNGPTANNCTTCLSGLPNSLGQCECIPGTCTTCPSTHYLLNGVCILLPVCNVGTYFNISTLSCKSCDPSCLTCIGPSSNNCLTCKSGLPNLLGACECVPGTCTSCPNNQYLLNGFCIIIPTCGVGRYFDQTALSCKSCDSSCLTCNGPTANNCTTCLTGLPNLSGECGCVPGTCQSCPSTYYLLNGFCVIKPICNNDEYFDETTYSCRSCDSSCLSCIGPTSKNCTTCKSDQILDLNKCVTPKICHSSCSDCEGSTANDCLSCPSSLIFTQTTSTTGTCTTECASDFYIVEDGGQRKCSEKVRINSKLTYSSTNDRYILTFNSRISSFYDTIKSQFTLSVVPQNTNSSRNYTYSLSLGDDNTAIVITFAFSGPIYSGDTLLIVFDNHTTNQSQYQITNSILSLPMLEYYPYSESIKQAIKTTTAINQVGLTSNQIFSTISPLLTKSSYSMTSQNIQATAAYFAFMNIQYPPNFIEFTKQSLKTSAPENFVSGGGSQESSKPNVNSRLLQQTPPTNPESQEEDTIINIDKYILDQSFWTNYGTTIIFMAATLGGIIVLEIMLHFITKKEEHEKKWYYKASKEASAALKWSFLINKFISSYQSLVMFSLLEAYNTNNSARQRKASLTWAIIGIAFAIVGMIGLVVVLRRLYKSLQGKGEEEQKKDDFIQQMKVLHASFKSEKFAQLLYPLILMIRSFGFMITVILIFEAPLAQLIFLLISTVLLILFLIMYKPMKKTKHLIVTILYELLFLLSIVGTLSLYVYNQKDIHDVETRTTLAFIIIAGNNGITFLNFFSFGIDIFVILIANLKSLRKKVTPNNEKALASSKTEDNNALEIKKTIEPNTEHNNLARDPKRPSKRLVTEAEALTCLLDGSPNSKDRNQAGNGFVNSPENKIKVEADAPVTLVESNEIQTLSPPNEKENVVIALSLAQAEDNDRTRWASIIKSNLMDKESQRTSRKEFDVDIKIEAA